MRRFIVVLVIGLLVTSSLVILPDRAYAQSTSLVQVVGQPASTVISTISLDDTTTTTLELVYTVSYSSTGSSPLPTSGFTITYTTTPSTDAYGSSPALSCQLSPDAQSQITPNSQASLTFLCSASWHYAPSPSSEAWQALQKESFQAMEGLIPVLGTIESISSSYTDFTSSTSQLESSAGLLLGVAYSVSLDYTPSPELVSQNSFNLSVRVSQTKFDAVNTAFQFYSFGLDISDGLGTASSAAYSVFEVLAGVCTIGFLLFLTAVGEGLLGACPLAGAVFVGSLAGTYAGLGAGYVADLSLYAIAYDPSPDFTAFVQPPSVSPALSNLVTNQQQEPGVQAIYDEFMYISLLNASDTSVGRANGALQAGATDYYRLQLQEAASYAENASAYYDKLVPLLGEIQANLTASGYVNQTSFQNGQEFQRQYASELATIFDNFGFGNYINPQAQGLGTNVTYAPTSPSQEEIESANAASLVVKYVDDLINETSATSSMFSSTNLSSADTTVSSESTPTTTFSSSSSVTVDSTNSSSGVSATTLYGVAAVAGVIIIATGYLVIRGRRPHSR